jgi:hypothetical protein
MAATAIIGTNFTFQALFRDSDGTALAVTTPLISVFYFDTTGTKQYVVTAVAMDDPTVAEVGRYVHAYTTATSFLHGDTLYAEMTGIHPGSGDTLVADETLLLQTSPSPSGFTSSFIS